VQTPRSELKFFMTGLLPQKAEGHTHLPAHSLPGRARTVAPRDITTGYALMLALADSIAFENLVNLGSYDRDH